jgi:hypothetical protein
MANVTLAAALLCIAVALLAGVIALFWLLPDASMRRIRFIERMKRRAAAPDRADS